MEACSVNGVASFNCVPVLFRNVILSFIIFAGTTALFLLVWGSIRFITSGGDPKKITTARSIMTYAIVGLLVVLSSFAIVYFIAYITGTTDCITSPEKILTGC